MIYIILIVCMAVVVSAGEFGYNNLDSIGLTPDINYTVKNVNSSEFWDDLDTPDDFVNIKASGQITTDILDSLTNTGVRYLQMDGDPWTLAGGGGFQANTLLTNNLSSVSGDGAMDISALDYWTLSGVGLDSQEGFKTTGNSELGSTKATNFDSDDYNSADQTDMLSFLGGDIIIETDIDMNGNPLSDSSGTINMSSNTRFDGKVGIGRTPQYYSFEMEGPSTGAWFRRITDNAGTGRGTFFWFWRSQGTPASPTKVATGSQLGKIQFSGLDVDGTGFGSLGAIIDVRVDGIPATDDMPTSMDFQTSQDGSDTPVSAMLLNSTQDAIFGRNLISTHYAGSYTNGEASVCVYDNGTIFIKDGACT